jgi:hypothetical protein
MTTPPASLTQKIGTTWIRKYPIVTMMAEVIVNATAPAAKADKKSKKSKKAASAAAADSKPAGGGPSQ